MPLTKEPKPVNIAVYVLLIDPSTQHILTVQNENGSWSLPGGKKEPGETMAEAAIREAKEETGLDVSINGILHVHETSRYVLVTFTGEIDGGTLQNGDGVEILQVKWMTQNEVHQKLPWLRHLNLLKPNQASYHVD